MIFKDKPLRIDVYDQATIILACGTIGVFDQAGNYIPNTKARRHGNAELTGFDLENLAITSTNIEYMDEEVVYIGGLYSHWGHFIVDSTIRMWALDRAECQGKKIVVSKKGRLPLYKKLFELINISEERIIYADRSIKFRKIYIPEISYLPKCFVAANEFLNPFERIKNNIVLDKPVYDKIYLSRTHFTKYGTGELGEKIIQNLFQKNGYKVLYPEELCFEEQVWYYKTCSSLAITNGTIAHNVIFAQKGIRLIILNKFPQTENCHQKVINRIKEVKINYVDVYSKKSTRKACLMKLSRQLRDFCDQEGFRLITRPLYAEVGLRAIFALRRLFLVLLSDKSVSILHTLRLHWRNLKP